MLRLDGDDPEPLITSRFTPRRTTMGAAVEVPHRLIEVTQRLLLDHLTARSQPLVLGTGPGKLSALLKVGWRSVSSWVPPRVLLDRKVPHVPGVRAVVTQGCVLRGGGRQTVT
jgi:hypothetical protein